MSGIEYLNEWPPPDDVQTSSVNSDADVIEDDDSDLCHLHKKFKGANTKLFSATSENMCHSSMNTNYKSCHYQMANISLAHRWRKTKSNMQSNMQLESESKNPNTQLKDIAKSEEGQRFLQLEISRLREILQKEPECAQLHAALGSHYELTRDLSNAEEHLTKSLELKYDAEHKWLLHRIRKQRHVLREQNINLQLMESQESQHLNLPKSEKVERRLADTLSVSEFYSEYSQKKTPVIITGLTNKLTSSPWNLKHILEMAGDCVLNVKRRVPGSVEWAQLEDADTVTVKDHIASLSEQDTLPISDKTYLFDWSLPLYSPKLAQQLTIPKYFAGDFLQRTHEGSLYHDSWPSMFISPKGLSSELHVDAFGSNFWMALFQGRKRWTFFRKEDSSLLYPLYHHSMDPTFDVDLDNPDLDKHPLLSSAKPMQCILEPGEVLFVPAGCPHRVDNLEQSLAISGNFVDLSNLTDVKRALEIDSLLDERAEDLLRQFNDENFSSEMDFLIDHTPWAHFKKTAT